MRSLRISGGEAEPDLDQMFPPWFVFNWTPDNTDVPPDEHFPEMPVALHYLEQKGRRLDSFTPRFIEEACFQPYSFFMIAEAEPGVSLTLKDLLLERTVRVLERLAGHPHPCAQRSDTPRTLQKPAGTGTAGSVVAAIRGQPHLPTIRPRRGLPAAGIGTERQPLTFSIKGVQPDLSRRASSRTGYREPP